MSEEVVIHECPQCGAPAQLQSNVCQYCKAEFLIKSLNGLNSFNKLGIDKYIASYKKAAATDPNNNEINAALGMCYLKLGLYDFASKFYLKAIEDMVENSDVYFYAALSLLKGKRPFLSTLSVIRKAEELLEAAVSLNPAEGKYYYAHAIVKNDFYHKKCINTSPDSQSLFQNANDAGFSDDDKQMIVDYMAVSL
ncbi:hypothetical protein [Paenibacillus andongensis]|uniref:hypothetical protein n=1 Tax=Paenibacillus andongensis TaxID=2975482 RepID=UPI0021BB01E9|nr:hypothetical protein [Paenibacillus andongensis]